MTERRGNPNEHGAIRQTLVELWRRRSRLRPIALWTMAVLAMSTSAISQESDGQDSRVVQLGARMSAITPTLLDIAQKTNFFLSVANQAGFDPEQTQALEDLYYEASVYQMRRAADLDVEEAELRRLFTRDAVDLDALLERLERVGAIEVELKMHTIETLLKAIQVLSHEQHLALMTQALD